MYGFNVRNFIAEIGKSGVAHPTRYSIMFESTPTGLIKFSRTEQEKMNTRLQTISFPQVGIGSKPVNLAGLDREMPYGRVYEGDLDMEFIEDGTLSIRSMFERWQGQIVDEETLRVGYYNNYVCNLKIILDGIKTTSQTSQRGVEQTLEGFVGPPRPLTPEEEFATTPVYSVTVFDVWPKTIEAIELGAEKGDELIKTKVSLSYRMWRSDNQLEIAGRKFTKTAGIGSLFGI